MRPNILRALLAAVFLCAGGAFAQGQPVGRVLLAAGDTFAVRNGQPVRLAYNSPVEFKDVLRTGAQSSLQVRFVDEGLISLRENSEFAIEDYKFAQEKPDEERAFFRLIKGGFRSVTGLIGRARHASYRVQTQTATIGIRGTDYAARLCQGGECGANVKDGLYGTVLGISSGTNQITVQNEGTPQPVTFGIGQNFFIPDAKTAPQQLLQPPTFVSFRPQGKAQAAQQGGQGSGGEQASSSSGVSAESRPQSPTSPTTSDIQIVSTNQYTVTNTVTSTGSSALLPGFTLGGLGIVPGTGIGSTGGGDEGGGAFMTPSMLTLGANGIPTAINIPSGCTGPNGNGGCKGGFTAVNLGTPVESGSAAPDGATNQMIFWGRWQTGTVTEDQGPVALSSAINAHFLYGTLTPAEVLAAKSGTLSLSSNSLGTTPTNNLGELASPGGVPSIQVNFTSRTATVSATTVLFPSQTWTLPSGTGAITIVPGSGGYFLIQGSGNPGGGWNCTGTACSGVATVSAKAAGIFLGPVGDHAGVTLGAQAQNSSGQTVANFGTVRVYCPAGC